METVCLDSIINAVNRYIYQKRYGDATNQKKLPMTEEQKQVLNKQKQVFEKVLFVLSMNIEFENGQLVFMTEDEFVAEGFPKSYYPSLMRYIETVNYSARLGSIAAKVFYRMTLDSRQQYERGIKHFDRIGIDIDKE
jgi:hypothetical protein